MWDEARNKNDSDLERAFGIFFLWIVENKKYEVLPLCIKLKNLWQN